MVNNTTDIITDPGIPVSEPYVLLIAIIIIFIITAIICYSLRKWGSEYIKLSPANRPDLLNYITVLVLILAVIVFGLTKNIDSDAITTLIGAIAGYIFGVTTDPKLLKSKGQDSKPFAKIKINNIKGDEKSVSVDGSSSVDPAGNQLSYNWTILLKPDKSTVTPDKSEEVNPTFTVTESGTYEIQLIVNNGTQSSNPATVQIYII